MSSLLEFSRGEPLSHCIRKGSHWDFNAEVRYRADILHINTVALYVFFITVIANICSFIQSIFCSGKINTENNFYKVSFL